MYNDIVGDRGGANVALQFFSNRPLFDQLAEKMIISIVSREYPEEKPFPDVLQISSELAVNPNTVRRVLEYLASEKLLVCGENGLWYPSSDLLLLEAFRRKVAQRSVQEFLTSMRTLSYTPEEAAEMIREVTV